MRWFHIAVVGLFAVLIVVFAVENFQTVTLSFLGWSISVPMVLQVVVVYLLGMATGSSLLALLRRSIAGAKPSAEMR
jgi:uncharacterized integral membrane protein